MLVGREVRIAKEIAGNELGWCLGARKPTFCTSPVTESLRKAKPRPPSCATDRASFKKQNREQRPTQRPRHLDNSPSTLRRRGQKTALGQHVLLPQYETAARSLYKKTVAEDDGSQVFLLLDPELNAPYEED
ncbi:MAG: hypothetical protein LQ350_001713 [Teloschistes chrysophthalmus]|nr:MAG: hypothetical protein LQ350_001713 [Niorma chrysophthalma]